MKYVVIKNDEGIHNLYEKFPELMSEGICYDVRTNSKIIDWVSDNPNCGCRVVDIPQEVTDWELVGNDEVKEEIVMVLNGKLRWL